MESSQRQDACCSTNCNKVPFPPSSTHIYQVGWRCWYRSWWWVMNSGLNVASSMGNWLPLIPGCSLNCFILASLWSILTSARSDNVSSLLRTLMAFSLSQNKNHVFALPCENPAWSGPSSSFSSSLPSSSDRANLSWPPCSLCMSKLLPSASLCPCWLLPLPRTLLLDILRILFPVFYKSCLKCHVSSEAFPDHAV